MKPWVVEYHSRTDQGGRYPQSYMPAPENGVIDLFTQAVQNGDIRVPILGRPVCLDSLYSGVKDFVDLCQKV